MPLPEGYLPRQGDVVVIHGIVKYNVDPGDTYADVMIEGKYSSVHIELDKIAGLHCRHWNEGDKVHLPGRAITDVGEVIATNGDNVWIAMPGGSMATYHANQLTEVPKTPNIPEPAPDGRNIGLRDDDQ